MNVYYMKKPLILLLLNLSYGVLYLYKVKMHNINIIGRVHMFQGLAVMWKYQFILDTSNSKINVAITSRNKEGMTNKLMGMIKNIFKPKSNEVSSKGNKSKQ